jgi:HlyD family secretion protein
MPDQQGSPSRQQALARISSLESLDRLMPVVSAKDWIPLLVIGGLFAVGGVWAAIGRLPNNVMGKGVLLRPHRIVPVQSLSGGRLDSLAVHAGQIVAKGDLLGRVDQSELRRRIQDDKQLLLIQEVQNQSKTATQQQQMSLQEQQDQLERRFQEAQRQSVARSLADAQALSDILKRRYDGMQEMRKAGLIAEVAPEIVGSDQAYRDNEARILDLKAKLEQIDGQAKQIETRLSTLVKENLEATTARENQRAELQARIAQNEIQLSKSGDIVSEYGGRVTEVFAATGQVIPAGGSVLSLEIEDPGAALVSLLYFPVSDGKKIQAGMPIQVIPTTVERQRFGGIVGNVVSVSPLPVTREGALSTVGNSDVLRDIMGDGAYVEVTAQLETLSSTFSGYRWSSSRGPNQKMSSGLTVQGLATVESRAPITYLLPLLRESSGIY